MSQQDLGESEADSLKMQLVEAEANLAQLDSLLMERSCEISQLKKVQHIREIYQEFSSDGFVTAKH